MNWITFLFFDYQFSKDEALDEAFITTAEGISIITVDHPKEDFLKNPIKQEQSEGDDFPYKSTWL